MIKDRDPSASRKLCVLLLEDDDADAYLTRRALSSLPQVDKVIRVKNGKEAVDFLKSGGVVPDIVFVDLHMPTMDGHDFMSACSDQRLPNIPMVMLTSSSVVKDAVRSRVRGALRVITKMENLADLRQALAEAIDACTGPAPPLYPADWSPTWLAIPQEPIRERRPGPGAEPASPPQFGRRPTTM